MKKQMKIITLVLSLVIILGAAFGMTIAAEGEGEGSLHIISQNVLFADKLNLYYAVYTEKVDTDVVLNVYDKSPELEDAKLLACVTESEPVTIPDEANGTSYDCLAFETPGVALKNMATEFYVQAVAGSVKSAVKKYSVVEYLAQMSFIAESAEERDAYAKLLAAGDAAQYLTNYYPNGKDDVPTNYNYVKVVDGTLANGSAKGVYLDGTALTFVYTGAEEVAGWNILNVNGEVLASVLNGESYTVTESVSVTPTLVPHEHEYSADWTYDRDNHWHVATCDKNAECATVVSEFGAHSITDRKCATCGYEIPQGRGTGVYADSALNFTNVTATALKEAGKLSGTFNFDGSTPSAAVVDSNGDNAFKMYSSSNNAYVTLAKTGDEYKNMVFETDLMIEAGADTWRDDMSMVLIYGQYSGTNSYWGLGTMILSCERVWDAGNLVGRKYYIACNNTNSGESALKYEIAADSWHTLRVERKDLTASSDVNVYIDGILVHTFTSTDTTTAITGMKIQTMDQGAKTVYFDNMYFGAAKEE